MHTFSESFFEFPAKGGFLHILKFVHIFKVINVIETHSEKSKAENPSVAFQPTAQNSSFIFNTAVYDYKSKNNISVSTVKYKGNFFFSKSTLLFLF